MTTRAHVVGVGARTPLGLGSASSAAAYRASLNGASLCESLIGLTGEALTLAVDPNLPPGMSAAARMAALARTAIEEIGDATRDFGAALPPIGIFVGLPEVRPGFSEQDAKGLCGSLRDAAEAELSSATSRLEVVGYGHASGIAAIGRAKEQVCSGAVDVALVGGVDSYIDRQTLLWLDGDRRIVSSRARDGFVPGEGAGFLLLMTPGVARRIGCDSLAEVRLVKSGYDRGGDEAMTGEGLADVLRQVIAGRADGEEPIDTIVCDVNGERRRGEEWGFACLRVGPGLGNPSAYVAPADGFGDLGAASGPVFAILSCVAAQRGYATGPHHLIWAGSDHGLRAAALLDTRRVLVGGSR